MKNVILFCMAILIFGSAQAQYGVMTRTFQGTETDVLLNPKKSYPRSVTFIDKIVTEGGHISHVRYIETDMGTIDWPELLSIPQATALLNKDSSSVLVTQDTYTRTGIMDFVMFWRKTYERRTFSFSLMWTDDGKPYFSEPKKVEFHTIHETQTVWLIVFLSVFSLSFFLWFFNLRQEFIDDPDSGSNTLAWIFGTSIAVSLCTLVIAIMAWAILLFAGNGAKGYENVTTTIAIFLSPPLGMALGIGMAYIRNKFQTFIKLRNFR